jgi:hypothetical protein
MAYDPNLPADGTPLNSAEMRMQLQGLQSLIDAIASGDVTGAQVDSVLSVPAGESAAVSVSLSAGVLHFSFQIPQGAEGAPGAPGTPGEVSLSLLQSEIGATARHPTTVMDLNLGVSDPPTAFEVQTIAHKVDELLAALRRP